MARFIELTAVNLELERTHFAALRNAEENRSSFVRARGGRDVELEDLPAGVVAVSGDPADEAANTDAPEGLYWPISIAVEAVREFYPRRGADRTGTRIVLVNGAAHPVKESYDEVKARLAALNTP